MNAPIPPKVEAYLRKQVAAGRFPSERAGIDALLTAGMQALEAGDVDTRDLPDWHAPLVQEGLEAAERGDFADCDPDSILAEADGRPA